MAIQLIKQVRRAIRNLNPDDVRTEAGRPLSIGLVAPSTEGLWRMEQFLCPFDLRPTKRAEISRMIHRIDAGQRGREYDIELWDESLDCPAHVFAFDSERPELTVREVLRRRPDLALSLARHIQPFRGPVIDDLIGKVSRENALFSVATALPDMIPLLSLPWAAGEFASDSAFLTANQIRLAFLIAAASDRAVGYREQKGQIGSIVAGAFGLRALARELIGKIPFGGGLLPKAAVAYAGTYVVGRSMERYNAYGREFTREERRSAFEAALLRGQEIAGGLLAGVRVR